MGPLHIALTAFLVAWMAGVLLWVRHKGKHLAGLEREAEQAHAGILSAR